MPFINNNSLLEYNKLIIAAKNRETDGQCEKHHIVPRSLGGDEQDTNIVNLSPSEHLYAHKLLTEITAGLDKSKMIYAYWMMANVKNVHQSTRLTVSPAEFEKIKLLRKMISASEETRNKIANSRRGKVSIYNKDNNQLKYINLSDFPEYESKGFILGGRPLLGDRKKQISDTNKKLGIKPVSIGWNTGLTKNSNESIRVMAEKAKGRVPANKGKTLIELHGEGKAEMLAFNNRRKNATPVTIHGITYYSIIEASRQLKITERRAKKLGGIDK